MVIEKKILKDTVDLVKNIPSTDEIALEKFESTEWTDILVPLQKDDVELKITPKSEYEVVVESSLYKFNNKVNDMISQWWFTTWWVSVVQTNTWTKFYQSMERRNVDFVEKSEMPSQNSEGDTQGPKPLYIPGLENEPDLYEDTKWNDTNW